MNNLASIGTLSLLHCFPTCPSAVVVICRRGCGIQVPFNSGYLGNEYIDVQPNEIEVNRVLVDWYDQSQETGNW